MTPEERDVARANARAALSEHPSTCAGRECLLARAALAFVPSGDVSAPEGYHLSDDGNGGIALDFDPYTAKRDAATMRALGLTLVAQADALAGEG